MHDRATRSVPAVLVVFGVLFALATSVVHAQCYYPSAPAPFGPDEGPPTCVTFDGLRRSGDRLNGKGCGPFDGIVHFDSGTVDDASLIGPAPFDLGAVLQGTLTPNIPQFDPSATQEAEILGRTPARSCIRSRC